MASASTSRRYSSCSTYGMPTRNQRYSTHSPMTGTERRWCAQRPPRASPARRSVAQWEKDFCESCGVPWKEVMDAQEGNNFVPDAVDRWDDSGAVEALRAAKRRYWAEINGGLAAPPLPDPDLHNDVIADEEDVTLDPNLVAEYEEALRAMEVAWEENAKREEVQVVVSKLPDGFVPVPTGWDDVAPVEMY